MSGWVFWGVQDGYFGVSLQLWGGCGSAVFCCWCYRGAVGTELSWVLLSKGKEMPHREGFSYLVSLSCCKETEKSLILQSLEHCCVFPIWVQQCETNRTGLSMSGMGAEIAELLSCKHPFSDHSLLCIAYENGKLRVQLVDVNC